jgi:hypothetical protein
MDTATVQFMTVTLTSTQILAMGASPSVTETLLAAPGAGLATVLLWCTVQYNAGSVAYVDVHGNALCKIGFDNTSNVPLVDFPVSGLMDTYGGTNQENICFPSPVTQSSKPLANVQDLPLVISISNTVTTGNGTLLINLYYASVEV